MKEDNNIYILLLSINLAFFVRRGSKRFLFFVMFTDRDVPFYLPSFSCSHPAPTNQLLNLLPTYLWFPSPVFYSHTFLVTAILPSHFLNLLSNPTSLAMLKISLICQYFTQPYIYLISIIHLSQFSSLSLIYAPFPTFSKAPPSSIAAFHRHFLSPIVIWFKSIVGF